jgi:hypothetical protein
MRSPVLNATAAELQSILNWQRGCLAKELEITNPTAVLFFTGPNYDQIILDEFPGARFEGMGGRPIRQFAQVCHDSLPVASFRTYHPGYLARGKWSWIDELANKVIAHAN